MKLKTLLLAGLFVQIAFAQDFEKVKPQDLRSSVDFLSSDVLKGRETATQGELVAAQFIRSKFIEAGIKPYFNTYFDTFESTRFKGVNVVGFIEGSEPELKDEIVLLGAHYDHIGLGPKVKNDSIANGANDNASGTAAVLAIANRLARLGTNKRSVIVALFSGEEKGLLGSKALAKKIKAQNTDLYTMLNFEMIGVPFIDRDYEIFLTGYELSNLGGKLNTYTNSTIVGISDVAKKYNVFKRSDNYSFYKEFKVPSHTISSCDLTNFDFYHHVDDEIDQLDFVFMATTINKLIPGILQICNTDSKEIQMYETN
ncbi:M20/M25/M40 family metallo-hydrolase [Flavobacteriaceae bacterium]|nr:M20/M25/M40 family metallo-hydrolase [Flavobacteriaceae bacterium]